MSEKTIVSTVASAAVTTLTTAVVNVVITAAIAYVAGKVYERYIRKSFKETE